MAIFWQVVQGAMSSNVAMARTVVAEIYSDSDQKYVFFFLFFSSHVAPPTESFTLEAVRDPDNGDHIMANFLLSQQAD